TERRTAVTEAEWLACGEGQRLFDQFSQELTRRKLHLFACACCRRIWHLMHDGSRGVVERAEDWADGFSTVEELRVAIKASRSAGLDSVATNAVAAVGWFSDDNIARGVGMIAGNAACCVAAANVPGARTVEWEAVKEAEEAEQAGLFREIN